MRPRLTVGHSLAVVALCGVGLASLRDPSEWWASLVFTGALSVLAFAGLYSIFRKGHQRAFWSAFTAFGVGYLTLAFGPWFESSIRPRLLTTKLLDVSYPFFSPEFP